jgi:hypothetical protein
MNTFSFDSISKKYTLKPIWKKCIGLGVPQKELRLGFCRAIYISPVGQPKSVKDKIMDNDKPSYFLFLSFSKK